LPPVYNSSLPTAQKFTTVHSYSLHFFLTLAALHGAATQFTPPYTPPLRRSLTKEVIEE
jgi:hypothetical protein